MRNLFLSLMLAAAWLVPGARLNAGLYSTEDKALQTLPTVFREYQALLFGIRGLAVERRDPAAARSRYLERIEQLEDRERHGLLTVDDRINLSAYYLLVSNNLRSRYEDASRVLEAVPAEQRNFMVLGNLATAHHLAGRLERAEIYLEQSARNWPHQWPGLTSHALNWYARIERYQLLLIQSRMRETRLAGGRPAGLDPLFPRVRFIGPSGEYEPGLLAADQWANLPADALTIVSQLVLWYPYDDRLYWLLAELLNAQGDFLSAFACMDDLVFVRNFTASRELKRHRDVLREAKRVGQLFKDEPQEVYRERLLAAMPPLGPLLPVGAAPVLDAVGQVIAIEKVLREPPGVREDPAEATEPKSQPTPTEPKGQWLPDWRQIGVSFLAGALFATLVHYQVREVRRRRAAK